MTKVLSETQETQVRQVRRFSPSARGTLRAAAAVAMPAGAWIPQGGEAAVDRLERMFGSESATLILAFEGLALLLEQGSRLRFGRRFSRLSPDRQLAYLHSLYNGSYPERMLARGVLTPLKTMHYDDPQIFAGLDCSYARPPVNEPRPRYLDRSIDLAANPLDDGEEIEADVVVVGTGAGGGAVAAELAEMGHAVVLVEEGGYFRRPDFSGRPLDMMRMMYRSLGMTGTVGNCVIPIPLGKCVGGTTTINSGTCYRTPERVLRKWRDEHGLGGFSAAEMDPYFERVESVLQVARADPKLVGPIGDIVARGAARLGYTHHGPLLRNAPDCDGSALCCFGCPTDAKRGSNVSYVPLALRYGANLFYNAHAERILVEGGRAVGVEAVTPGGRKVRFRAPAVVLAAGAQGTPLMLLRQKLGNRSGQVGANLSIHPAIGLFGLFDDAVNGCRSIPQGYSLEEFHEEGLLFEGVFVPLDTSAGSVTFFGRRFTEVLESYNNVASFGFMVEDTSRGRVRLGPGGAPLMTYFMNDDDVARLKRGTEIIIRLLLAAGAKAVFPQLPGFTEVHDERDLERFRRTRFRARDFDLTAHHPLGTCRMGREPARSVVGPTHEAHDVPGLFICDGSAVPSSLGVNPMLTIMALATRAAQFVARAAERGSAARALGASPQKDLRRSPGAGREGELLGGSDRSPERGDI